MTGRKWMCVGAAAIVAACMTSNVGLHAQVNRTALRSESSKLEPVVGGANITGEKNVIFLMDDPAARKNRQFWVLQGGLNNDGDECVSGGASCIDGSGAVVVTPDLEWEMHRGYAFIRGWRPRARTNRATAAAEGTSFFIQIDMGGDEMDETKWTHRFVLVEGGPLVLHLRGSTDVAATLTAPFTFVEVTEEQGTIKCTLPTEFVYEETGESGQLRKLVRSVMNSSPVPLLR